MLRCFLVIACLVMTAAVPAEEPTPNPLAEESIWRHRSTGVRTYVNAPATSTGRPRTLLIYATPNGSSIEHTLGAKSPFAPQRGSSKDVPADLDRGANPDSRYDLQHVAAQVRMLRGQDDQREWLFAVTDCAQRSWPSFRQTEPHANRRIGEQVHELVTECHADQFVLAGHSGGGSFMFGFLESVDAIPSTLVRIVFLDANYAYDSELHADKLLTWLRGDRQRHLVIIAYDDREIMLDGKKVVSPTGGTYRATDRMVEHFAEQMEFTKSMEGPIQRLHGWDGQVQIYVHQNPENKILHTALVGEMNGLLHGLTVGNDNNHAGSGLAGPRAYERWIPESPEIDPATPNPGVFPLPFLLAIPPRPENAIGGSEFAQRIHALSLEEREQAILEQLRAGNVPDRLRTVKAIHATTRDQRGRVHQGTYFVTPDYVAVGDNDDFVRMPLTPGAAEEIAEAWKGAMITTKVSDDAFAAAELRQVPQPMTDDRESVATFLAHQQRIESQWDGASPNALVVGIKKDVVTTRRLAPGSDRVAIYGWHQQDGVPIQPLSTRHANTYVDYSHGIRLMADRMWVDGQATNVRDVLQNRDLAGLLGNE